MIPTKLNFLISLKPQPVPIPQPIPQQRCFPQWKYECSGGTVDRVRGITRVKKVCTTIRAKDCRIIPDIIERSIQVKLNRITLNLC